jgi:hypothetical protein
MSGPEHHQLLGEIANHFEALAAKLEHAIELIAEDDSGTVDLSALHRAKASAERGATITRSSISKVRRAFD